MTRVDIRNRCGHGLPVEAFCADCLPPSRPPETSLVADLDRAAPTLELAELHLPPTGSHAPRVDRARGVWTVTCSCGSHRLRSADRHDQESAWGRHRNGLS